MAVAGGSAQAAAPVGGAPERVRPRLVGAARFLRACAAVAYLVAVGVALTPVGDEVFRSGVLHPPFVVLLAAAAAVVAAAAWSRHRIDRTSESYLLALAFGTLAVVYAPHALLDAEGFDAPDLLFGPLSRSAFALALLAAVVGVHVPRLRGMGGAALAAAVLSFALVMDAALHSGLLAALYESDPTRVRRVLESFALVTQCVALAWLAARWWRTRHPFALALAATVAVLASGSALFLTTEPWQGRWWIAHTGLALAAVIVSTAILEERTKKGVLSSAVTLDVAAILADHIVDGMHDGLALHDARGKLVGWNGAAAAITGWSRDEAAQEFDPNIAEGLVHLNGRAVRVHRFEISRYGRPYAVTLFADATAELALEQAYQREQDAARRLRELDELKDLFLRTVAHDVRTPLSAIRGGGETLRARADTLSPDQRDALVRLVCDSALRLERLVDDMLDLDRVARGSIEPRRQRVDLGALVHSVVDVAGGDGRVRVEVEPLEAETDAALVERIVENLVSNALRHTADGTPVDVFVRSADGGVLIGVDDAGSGVPDGVKSAIFEPFRRGDSTGGTGVGLSVVAQFARLLGGRAWVEDRAGGGAAFRVFLPT